MIKTLKLSQLESDPRNANVCDQETLEKLGRNIQRTGQCPALIVRPHPELENAYILIDGHHRKQVLEKLGWEEVPCEIWDLPDSEIQILLATLNRLRGTDNPRKRAELLDSLIHHFSVEELTSLLPETPAEIEDALALLNFDFDELEKTHRNQIQLEKESLPVPYTFMVAPQDVASVEEALKCYPSKGKDRTPAFVALCHQRIEKGCHGQ